MMISRPLILVIALVLSLWGTAMPVQMAERPEPSSLQKENSPQFEDYPAVDEFRSKPVEVDLSSHPKARYFRTRLKDGAKKGPNFAGHYTLVLWGCGNECQMSLIIDLRNGKVYGLAEPPMNRPLQSSRGLDFR